MKINNSGNKAEQVAADYLRNLKFVVLEQNYKTKYCEIDIVSQKEKVLYFVEVKYRKQSSQGFGLDYITPTKLRQMRFAAEIWINENKWEQDYILAAMELGGDNFNVTNFVVIEQ